MKLRKNRKCSKLYCFILGILAACGSCSLAYSQTEQPHPLRSSTVESEPVQKPSDRIRESLKRKRPAFYSLERDGRFTLGTDGEKVEMLLDQAQIYRKAGIIDGFRRNIRAAVELANGDVSVMTTVAAFLIKSHQTEDCQYAVDLATDSMVWHGSNDLALASKAAARMCLGDYIGAFDDLTEAIKISPDNITYQYARSDVVHHVKDTAKALELQQIVIDGYIISIKSLKNSALIRQYKSSLASAYIGRSYTYKKIGDRSLQLADLSSAVEVYPLTALRSRAEAYRGYGMATQSTADATAYIKLEEARYGPGLQREVWGDYMWRASLFTEFGKVAEAIADYQKALELNPRNPAIPERISALTDKLPK